MAVSRLFPANRTKLALPRWIVAPLDHLQRLLESWRRQRHRGDSTPVRARLGTIGTPENEVNAGSCLAKGEVLRRAGRAMEAQPFLRQAPRLASSRRGAGAMAVRAAGSDTEFQRLVEEADRARDNAQWSEAADLYRLALQIYPDHFGYTVQYAHCLKEQGQFAEAECHYRSALALGAPRRDIDAHLAFVASRQGFPGTFVRNGEDQLVDDDPLSAAPAKADVELLIFLLLGREPLLAETLQLLREQRSIRGVILGILDGGSFASANTRLLSSAIKDVEPIKVGDKRVIRGAR